MTVCKLSDAGRAMLWQDYQTCGYGLSHLAQWNLSRVLGPIAHWAPDLTLGRMEDACAAAGREIAWVFNEMLKLPALTMPYTFNENTAPDLTGLY